MRRLLGVFGAFLLSLSGQSDPAQANAAPAAPSADTQAGSPAAAQPAAPTALDPAGPQSAPAFTVAAHSNTAATPRVQLSPELMQVRGLEEFQGIGKSHVNSGPTKHTNVPGHANFTKVFENPAQRLNPAQLKAMEQGFAASFGQGASHVNSGPTKHTNVPGHANFTKVMNPAAKFQPAQIQMMDQALR